MKEFAGNDKLAVGLRQRKVVRNDGATSDMRWYGYVLCEEPTTILWSDDETYSLSGSAWEAAESAMYQIMRCKVPAGGNSMRYLAEFLEMGGWRMDVFMIVDLP